MQADMRLRSNEEEARRWLKHQLEWEEILAALRDTGRGGRVTAELHREPAAA